MVYQSSKIIQKHNKPQKSNRIYENKICLYRIERLLIVQESDDWARKSERPFSRIISKTIACVNKMRVNKYVYQIHDVDKMYIEINPVFIQRIVTTIHTLSLQLLSFRITYGKSPIMYIRVRFIQSPILRFLRSQWHIQANWGITLKLWINWMNLKMFKIEHMCCNWI